MKRTNCAASVCQDRDQPKRGGKRKSNLYGAGDNYKDMVMSGTISVIDSTYVDPCPHPNHQIAYEARKNEIFDKLETREIEKEDWVPKQEYVNYFPWDGCDIIPPSAKCTDADWPQQLLGHENVRKNVNNPD